MEPVKQRILEIVLDQRSVSDSTIALQIQEQLEGSTIRFHTSRLEQQGLIAESPLAAGRWHITDAGRSALPAD